MSAAPPTLVLLLKAPRLGEVKTRLAAALGPARALAIYRQLAERQVRALPPVWPVTIHFTPADATTAAEMGAWLTPLRHAESPHSAPTYYPQPDGDLGVRLTAAFAHAFAAGAPSVIALGGDCPSLDSALLHRAADALAQPGTDAILGPAADGGYYLIGLRAPRAELFADIAWSTPAVLTETRARLRTARLRTIELPVLHDLDDAHDWHRAVAAGLLPADSLTDPAPVNNR